MNKSHTSSQFGFTIIELMIATAIFSAVLVIILASFLQVGRIYYKGVSISSTNEAARTLVDDIASDIRITQQQPVQGSNYFCIGQHRYTYELGQGHQVQPNDITSPSAATSNGIILDHISSGCGSAGTLSGTNPQQLLGANMQLNNLNLQCNQFGGQGCTIDAHVIFYGADSNVFYSPSGQTPILSATDAECSGNLLSTQFCSVSDFSDTVLIGGI